MPGFGVAEAATTTARRARMVNESPLARVSGWLKRPVTPTARPPSTIIFRTGAQETTAPPFSRMVGIYTRFALCFFFFLHPCRQFPAPSHCQTFRRMAWSCNWMAFAPFSARRLDSPESASRNVFHPKFFLDLILVFPDLLGEVVASKSVFVFPEGKNISGSTHDNRAVDHRGSAHHPGLYNRQNRPPSANNAPHESIISRMVPYMDSG